VWLIIISPVLPPGGAREKYQQKILDSGLVYVSLSFFYGKKMFPVLEVK